ncbi:radical SAM protein, partial [candidate division KSB1 bacterium]|nr:radical SAM protein [candidate division KSB1 bacterium]
ITGGEPTLSPDFYKIMGYLHILNLPFTLYSNGIWNYPQLYIDLFLTLTNLKALVVSLHGHDAETHHQFTRIQCFDQVIQNLQLAHQNGLAFKTNTVFFKQNIRHLNKIAELSRRLGATLTIFSRYYGEPKTLTDLSLEALRSGLQQVEQLVADGYAVTLNNCIPQCFVRNRTRACNAGFTFCAIDVEGNVRPCNHSRIIFGNIFEQAMRDIWKSASAQAWRDAIPQVCRECQVLVHCGGGCRALQEYTPDKIDPLIQAPIQQPLPPKKLRFFSEHKIKSNYLARQEAWGYLLYHENHILPVSEAAKKILDQIEMKLTVAQIQARYGAEVMQLVAALVDRDLITLKL